MKSSKGHALLSVVAILGALLVAGVAAIRMTRGELHGTANSVARQKAFYVAEAGVQQALARLSQDRATASLSTTYTYSQSNQPFAEGAYNVSVVQDPVFPTDATRKRITGVGTTHGQQATVAAQAQVQDALPSTICFTDTGTCKIQSLIALGLPPGDTRQLWSGDIFSNLDAAIETPIGIRVRGSGRIDVRNQFRDASLTIAGFPVLPPLLSTMSASLYSGVQYAPSGLLGVDLHTLPILRMGLHFGNLPGTGAGTGHGQVAPPAARPFPRVDWESLRRDPRTTIVNAADVPSGTSWDAASGTWIVGSVFAPALDSDTIYYVEGNVHVVSLQLVKGARMTIAARGWSVVEGLSVLNLGLIAGSTQDVRIITEKNNTVGLKLLAYNPLQLETTVNALTETGGLVGMVSGIGLNVASVATNNRIFAYSETGDVWAKTSTLSALSTTRLSMIAKHDATIAFTTTLGAGVVAYQ